MANDNAEMILRQLLNSEIGKMAIKNLNAASESDIKRKIADMNKDELVRKLNSLNLSGYAQKLNSINKSDIIRVLNENPDLLKRLLK